MASTTALRLVDERGWRNGLVNLLGQEARKWWGTRFGLLQVVIWVVILNGILALVLYTEGEEGAEGAELASMAVEVFFPMAMIFTTLGLVIIAQGAVVGEKRSGTVAWILSGPVSRSAFLLSKLTPIALGSLVTMMALPGVIAYLQISYASDTAMSAIPFLAGMSVVAVHLVFYLSLTLMLGTLFKTRGPVISVPIVLLFGGGLLMGFAPSWLAWATHWPLVEIAVALGQRQTPDSFIPIMATAAWSVVFVVIAIWRFGREEF